MKNILTDSESLNGLEEDYNRVLLGTFLIGPLPPLTLERKSQLNELDMKNSPS